LELAVQAALEVEIKKVIQEQMELEEVVVDISMK